MLHRRSSIEFSASGHGENTTGEFARRSKAKPVGSATW
jgi:hypothetical protein